MRVRAARHQSKRGAARARARAKASVARIVGSACSATPTARRHSAGRN